MTRVMTRVMWQNLTGSPSAFLWGGSKVIHGIIARKEGELGNEAKPGHHYTYRASKVQRSHACMLYTIICSKRQPGHHYTYRASTHVQQLSDNQQRRLEAETTHLERGASTAALCSTG